MFSVPRSSMLDCGRLLRRDVMRCRERKRPVPTHFRRSFAPRCIADNLSRRTGNDQSGQKDEPRLA
jgi:hypothetical protein